VRPWRSSPGASTLLHQPAKGTPWWARPVPVKRSDRPLAGNGKRHRRPCRPSRTHALLSPIFLEEMLLSPPPAACWYSWPGSGWSRRPLITRASSLAGNRPAAGHQRSGGSALIACCCSIHLLRSSSRAPGLVAGHVSALLRCSAGNTSLTVVSGGRAGSGYGPLVAPLWP